MKASNKTTNPPSPADLPQLIRSLAGQELRDGADALTSARSRRNQASSATGEEADLQLVQDLDEIATDTITYAEWALRNTLLVLWGVAVDYEDARNGPSVPGRPKAWMPCGALVESRWFVYITPGERDGQPDYEFEHACVHVVDNEDLHEMSDDDWVRLLTHPPCRYVVLNVFDKDPVVVEAAATS